MSRKHRVLAILSIAAAAVAGASYGQGPATLQPQIGAVLAEIEGELAVAETNLQDLTRQKARVDAEIESLTARRGEAQERLHSRARALYRLSQAGMLPVSGGFTTLLAHISRVDRLKRIVTRDVEAIASLRLRGGALAEETARLANAIEEARGEVSRLTERKDSVAEQQLATQLYDQALNHPYVVPAIPMDTLPGGSGIRVRDPSPHGIRFLRFEGSLPPPVIGGAELRNAVRRDGPGIEFLTQPGTGVRAVAQGRVGFARDYADYGQLVILDHGDGYYTVYGGLGRIAVQVGDYVSEGTSLGTVGHRPVSGALFFEVRQGTRTLDTRRWLGL